MIDSTQISDEAVAIAELHLNGSRPKELCCGFADNYKAARTVAVLEALERYSGFVPRAIVPCVRSSYSRMNDEATDPTLFGTFSVTQDLSNERRLVPYDPQMIMDFVWGFSYKTSQPTLIPLQLAYYSLGIQTGDLFVIEGSNGCALGASHEEAILHGLFEVVERDAFLLTWYAKRPVKRIDISKCLDRHGFMMVTQLKKLGYEVYAFDITTDYSIPAIWLLARHPRSDMPSSVSTSAANLSPHLALRKALRELFAVVQRYRIEMTDPRRRQYSATLAHDPTLVKTMLDHGLMYCAEEASKQHEFLLEDHATVDMSELENVYDSLGQKSVRDQLQIATARVLSQGSDVIAVEQTAPEVSSIGLSVFKVLVTNALSMCWGPQVNRIMSSPRLLDQLGILQTSINSAPHPFV